MHKLEVIPPSKNPDFLLHAKEEGIRRIARMAGIAVRDVDIEELKYIAAFYGDEGFLSPAVTVINPNEATRRQLLAKYLGRRMFSPYPGKRDYMIAGVLVQQFLQDVVLVLSQYEVQGDFKRISYGSCFPTYDQLLRFCTPQKTNQRSLLIGAMTPDTIAEYEVQTKRIFPGMSTFSMDLLDLQGRYAQCFVAGNGLALPFATGTMDVVQTSLLLHQLKTDSTFSHSAAATALYKEVARVLKPETGRVLFLESNLSEYFANQGRVLSQQANTAGIWYEELKQNGFKVVKQSRLYVYGNRHAVLAHQEGLSTAGDDIMIDSDGMAFLCVPQR